MGSQFPPKQRSQAREGQPKTAAEHALLIITLLFIAVSVMAGASTIGMCLGYPSGLLLEKCGVFVTLFTAIFLGAGGYLLIWDAVHHILFYSTHYGMMTLYFFMTGKLTILIHQKVSHNITH